MLSLQLCDERDNGESQQAPTDYAEIGCRCLGDDGCLYSTKYSPVCFLKDAYHSGI